ncbi:hypothetical protein [Sorangium sp. So ce1097]|uniref:hypothetical protein n=1 Tax=Sorangium sp. So ce1097 TaxID=3133330 RepID=UPI003F6473D3
MDKNLDVLRAYEAERQRIERLQEKEVRYRVRPPPNPHAEHRERLLIECSQALSDVDIIGYHCTRLHESEIQSVMRTGLRSLDSELVTQRIRDRVSAGDILGHIGEKLIAKHQAAEECRAGMVWFALTTGLLQDESGIYRLFDYWGGEAIYIAYEDDPEIGSMLRRLGIPCIVEAVIPAAAIVDLEIEERLLQWYLSERDIDTGHSPECEGYTMSSVGPERIRRVIRRSDPDFEQLTSCDTWQEPPT